MKIDKSKAQDAPLGKLLREWQEKAPLPPHFQDAVWQRIEQAPAPGTGSIWTGLTDWIGRMLPRPAFAAPYVALLLTLGVSAGWVQSRQETARVQAELGNRYLRVLDPYQAPTPER